MTSLETLVALATIFGVPLAVVGVFYTARASVRDARRDEQDRQRQIEDDQKAAVAEAVRAVQEDAAREIDRIRDERNEARAALVRSTIRIEQLEDQLRGHQ